MEEMRSFGYICPHCGKAVLHQRSVFALVRRCGPHGVRVRAGGAGGGDGRCEVPALGTLRCVRRTPSGGVQRRRGAARAGIGLACPEKQELCCYIGEEQQVRRAMEELALRVEKEKAGGEEAFTDNVIMYEVLSELKDIAARDGISCTCGSHKYSIAVRRAQWTSSAPGAAGGCGSMPPRTAIWTTCAAR